MIECCKKNNDVIPLFIFTPEQITNNNYKSDNAVQFMVESIEEVKKNIPLNLVYGNIEETLSSIIDKYSVKSIYMNTDYTPYAKRG